MQIKTPYLLYLGNAKDILAIKIAKGIVDWKNENSVGEYAMPECNVTAGTNSISIEEAKNKGAQTFVIGLANSGGMIAKEWLPDILKAIEAGFDIASGLHQRLADIPEINDAARANNCRLIDVRHSTTSLQTGTGKKRMGKRLLTVATDCSIGKMYTSLSIEREMKSRRMDAEFVATGQSGIFISGKGIAVDCVVSDFISGAVEMISPCNAEEHWDIIEGQGSLFHPAFAGVSLGLLHGAQPDAIVLCHQEGRDSMRGIANRPLPSVKETIELNLALAKLTNPKVMLAGISLITADCTVEQSQNLCKQYEDSYQVPCVDPMKHGVNSIVEYLAQ